MSPAICPRCDAVVTAGQEYCVDCGLRLPSAGGAVPALRRGWVRSLGWYPGDWIWPSLVALAIAAAGATGAILLSSHDEGRGTTFAATAAPASTTPAAPSGSPRDRLTVWPADTSGWTVVLVSLPHTGGAAAPAERARKAVRVGLPEAGYLLSDRFASLHPGYYVVFAGVYATRDEAEAAVPTARSKGFAGAYARPVVP